MHTVTKLATAMLIASASIAHASDKPSSTVNLTIYPSGSAFVQQTIQSEKPQSVWDMSALLKGLDASSLYTNLDHQLKSASLIKHTKQDRQLTVYLNSPINGAMSLSGKLHDSNRNMISLKHNGSVIGIPTANIAYFITADLPNDDAYWTYRFNGPVGEVKTSYQLQGVSWEPKYVAHLNTNNKMVMRSGVSLANNTDNAINAAPLSLVAGQVKQHYSPRPMMQKSARFNMMADASMEMASMESTPPSGEKFGHLTRFTYKEPVHIPANSVHRLPLNKDFNMDFTEKRQVSLNVSRHDRKRNATVSLNVEAKLPQDIWMNHLPAGSVKLIDHRGLDPLFVGDIRLADTAGGADVKFNLGKDHEVKVKSELLNLKASKKYDSVQHYRKHYTWEQEVVLSNHSDKAKDIDVTLLLSGHEAKAKWVWLGESDTIKASGEISDKAISLNLKPRSESVLLIQAETF
ncbi:DUF4139 domain-containing protein [Neptuniibacter sp. QD37_11]|uniref:DUF4139 domain-containing protein n=1 Tax=Neptuniibacter sp. QD37_11 TaxID=3398209 RepID=UPI0039F4AAC3